MDMQKERAEFEAWFGNTICDLWCADNREVQMAWEAWQAAKASAQTKITDLEEHNYSLQDKMHDLNALVAVTKASAVPEGRTDFEIIEQTIAIVDLLADANRFKRDKSKPFPFESENPRNIEWWRVACQIQELMTDTDPNNCDFEEYKAMIEAAQEQDHDL